MKIISFLLLSYLFVAASCQKLILDYEKSNVFAPFEPYQTILTWQQDPSTTMTITWRTDGNHVNHVLKYADSPEAPGSQWTTLEATTYRFAESKANLHTVEITGLEPNKDYYVVIEHPTAPDVFNFRTLPAKAGERELVMLSGGDSRTRRDVRRQMNDLAIKQNPDLVIFDGDFIATALDEQQWDEWFDDWHEQMITPDGRRIPVVPAIGNHEVAGSYLQSWDKAPFYYHRFVTPGPRNYYALTLRDDVVLVTLDSDHITEVTQQNYWLDSTLTAHSDKPWKLVQYHVAAWPSVRDFDGEIPVKIRQQWMPILEKHYVDLVMEAHDHAFKQTVPIRNNERNDEFGIVYIGDGGWGAPIRETRNPEEYWWLENAFPADHFWKLTLSKDGSEMNVEPVFLDPGFSDEVTPILLKNKELIEAE